MWTMEEFKIAPRCSSRTPLFESRTYTITRDKNYQESLKRKKLEKTNHPLTNKRSFFLIHFFPTPPKKKNSVESSQWIPIFGPKKAHLFCLTFNVAVGNCLVLQPWDPRGVNDNLNQPTDFGVVAQLKSPLLKGGKFKTWNFPCQNVQSMISFLML